MSVGTTCQQGSNFCFLLGQPVAPTQCYRPTNTLQESFGILRKEYPRYAGACSANIPRAAAFGSQTPLCTSNCARCQPAWRCLQCKPGYHLTEGGAMVRGGRLSHRIATGWCFGWCPWIAVGGANAMQVSLVGCMSTCMPSGLWCAVCHFTWQMRLLQVQPAALAFQLSILRAHSVVRIAPPSAVHKVKLMQDAAICTATPSGRKDLARQRCFAPSGLQCQA